MGRIGTAASLFSVGLSMANDGNMKVSDVYAFHTIVIPLGLPGFGCAIGGAFFAADMLC